MLKLPEAIFGTWQNDRERTLTELKRHLHPGHPKLNELSSPEHSFPLTIQYTPELVFYRYRDDGAVVKWRMLAHDEFTMVSEVETCWVNDQVLWHTHFISENCYWITVDSDWGFIYREFFTKIPPH